MSAPARVAVLGLGNVLRSDDGVGPFALRLLESRWELSPEVALHDLGTPGPELVDYLHALDAVVVVDSVAADGEPGELRTYDRDEILAAPPGQRVSPHDPSLREALATAEFAGGGPASVALVGVVPGSTALGTELTPPVRAALPRLEREVLRCLARLGVRARRREAPDARPDIWWQRPASG